MKVLAVHPSGLMYTRVFLRLEPLGLETVAAAVRQAGHDVRLIDLQVQTHRDFDRLVRSFQPDVLASRLHLPIAVRLEMKSCQRDEVKGDGNIVWSPPLCARERAEFLEGELQFGFNPLGDDVWGRSLGRFVAAIFI